MNAMPSRRSFFKTSAALSTIPLLSCESIQSNSSVDNKPLKLGLMTFNLAKEWDIDTIIKNCTETQFEHVELRTTHAHGVEVDLTSREREQVRKKFKDAGLKLSLASAFKYHWVEPEKVQQHIDGTNEYTLLARDIGAIGIRVFPNGLQVDKGIPEEQTLKQIGQALAQVSEFAHEHGVEIRVCVHGDGTDRIPRIKKIIDYSNSPHVYVNWNCSAHDTDDPGFETNFNMIKDRIRNIHLHELWNEDYPYRKLFTLLKQSGYQGYCDAEVSASCEPLRFMKYYRALFLALQNAI